MKKRIPQFELPWTAPEPMVLVAQTAVDGERLQHEADQRAADQADAATNQQPLFHQPETLNPQL